MIKCEICGHDYDKGVEVVVYGQPHRLHNFACAIRALAPRCAYCQRGIVGRGPAASGWTLCCDDCANLALPAPAHFDELTDNEHTMNPALTDLLPAARIAAASLKLNVTILYECLDTGKHAKRFTDQLAAELADVESANRALDLNLWSFGVLGIREVRNDSVGTAATADLVILSMSGKHPLPAQVEAWVEMWTWLIDGHKPAVVALFTASDTRAGRTRSYLRRAAVSKGLRFFPHTICDGADPHHHGEDRAEQRVAIDHQMPPHSCGGAAGSTENRDGDTSLSQSIHE